MKTSTINQKLTNMLSIILIIIFSLSYYYQGGNRGFDLDFGYFFPHIISILILCLALTKYKNSKESFKEIKGIKECLTPEIISVLLTIINFTISMISFSYFKHGVSAWALVILPIFEAISLMFLYKKNVIDFIFKASVLSYMFIVIFFVIQNGFMALFTTIYNQLFNNSNIMTVLEAHEITYVFGILFLFYVDDFKNNKVKVYICLFFMLLGFKRILFAAIIICLLYRFIVNKFSKKYFIKSIVLITSIMVVSFSYLWIHMLRDGYLKDNFYNPQTYLDTSGISGRLLLSFQLNDIYEFSPKFLGKGVGFVDQYRKENLTKNNLALHNDLLRKYIEYGFIFFGVYIFYKVYFVSMEIYKAKGKNSMIKYMTMIIMTVICWFTDNLAIFFVYLTVFNTMTMYLQTYEKNCNILIIQKKGKLK